MPQQNENGIKLTWLKSILFKWDSPQHKTLPVSSQAVKSSHSASTHTLTVREQKQGGTTCKDKRNMDACPSVSNFGLAAGTTELTGFFAPEDASTHAQYCVSAASEC